MSPVDARGGVLLALVLALAAAAAASSDGWTVFAPEGGRFRVEVPGEPELVVATRATPVGGVQMRKWWLAVDGVELSVETHDVPPVGAAITPDGVILDRSRAGVLDSTEGRETGWREIEVQGAPAREFRYEIAEGDAAPTRFGLARAILVGRRIYLLTGTAPSEPAEHPAVQRLLASFQFWE